MHCIFNRCYVLRYCRNKSVANVKQFAESCARTSQQERNRNDGICFTSVSIDRFSRIFLIKNNQNSNMGNYSLEKQQTTSTVGIPISLQLYLHFNLLFNVQSVTPYPTDLRQNLLHKFSATLNTSGHLRYNC